MARRALNFLLPNIYGWTAAGDGGGVTANGNPANPPGPAAPSAPSSNSSNPANPSGPIDPYASPSRLVGRSVTPGGSRPSYRSPARRPYRSPVRSIHSDHDYQSTTAATNGPTTDSSDDDACDCGCECGYAHSSVATTNTCGEKSTFTFTTDGTFTDSNYEPSSNGNASGDDDLSDDDFMYASDTASDVSAKEDGVDDYSDTDPTDPTEGSFTDSICESETTDTDPTDPTEESFTDSIFEPSGGSSSETTGTNASGTTNASGPESATDQSTVSNASWETRTTNASGPENVRSIKSTDTYATDTDQPTTATHSTTDTDQHSTTDTDQPTSATHSTGSFTYSYWARCDSDSNFSSASPSAAPSPAVGATAAAADGGGTSTTILNHSNLPIAVSPPAWFLTAAANATEAAASAAAVDAAASAPAVAVSDGSSPIASGGGDGGGDGGDDDSTDPSSSSKVSGFRGDDESGSTDSATRRTIRALYRSEGARKRRKLSKVSNPAVAGKRSSAGKRSRGCGGGGGGGGGGDSSSSSDSDFEYDSSEDDTHMTEDFEDEVILIGDAPVIIEDVALDDSQPLDDSHRRKRAREDELCARSGLSYSNPIRQHHRICQELLLWNNEMVPRMRPILPVIPEQEQAGLAEVFYTGPLFKNYLQYQRFSMQDHPIDTIINSKYRQAAMRLDRGREYHAVYQYQNSHNTQWSRPGHQAMTLDETSVLTLRFYKHVSTIHCTRDMKKDRRYFKKSPDPRLRQWKLNMAAWLVYKLLKGPNHLGERNFALMDFETIDRSLFWCYIVPTVTTLVVMMDNEEQPNLSVDRILKVQLGNWERGAWGKISDCGIWSSNWIQESMENMEGGEGQRSTAGLPYTMFRIMMMLTPLSRSVHNLQPDKMWITDHERAYIKAPVDSFVRSMVIDDSSVGSMIHGNA